ncbi:hypothetical protein PoB_001966800 [Plakobranchus ocellatus]|uniref:Uncharacterized protein n=1 Tax=Plakobranchus ocellatus TaxID=259542 RepID=A0AAV3ZEZ8_9GAST|nr:hypothetical protein PoB_001966800 [Plakobranchus ocellatus]
MPELKVNKSEAGDIIFGGDYIHFECTALIRTNGSIFWRLTTASCVYEWHTKGHKGPVPLPNWATIHEEDAAGVPELSKEYEGMFVLANCSADVGSNGSLQWVLLISDWLKYCWTIDTNENIKGNVPSFLIQDNETTEINYTFNPVTGPHIESKIKFWRPADWEKSLLQCTVDNPLREYAIRKKDRPGRLISSLCENVYSR